MRQTMVLEEWIARAASHDDGQGRRMATASSLRRADEQEANQAEESQRPSRAES